MCGVWCSHCHKLLPVTEFFVREDRPELYKWCKTCMRQQGREPDWPPVEERGDGKITKFWELN